MATSLRMTIFALFFVSGTCGLIYQITWMRMFRLVMGNTVFTSATVLTVFMAGLALGSYLAGRLVDRQARPLRNYGLLEGAIGLYCLAVPLLFAGVEPAYRFAYVAMAGSTVPLALVRFLISAALLILPTTLMGATLPLLSRYLAGRHEELGRDVGRLYGLNTLGAAMGAAATGFLLVPALGVHCSILAAAAANLAICAVSLWLDRHPLRGAESRPAPGGPPTTRPGSAAVLWALAGAGFASMVYEVAWTRVLSQLIGSSVYAFTLMLAAFICGPGAGALTLSGVVDRTRNLRLFLGGLEITVGLASMLVVPMFSRLPLYVVGMVTRYAGSFGLLHLVEFGTVFALMLVPTFAMGGIFPAVAKLYTRDMNLVGRSVGEAYGANTVGSVLGSFAGGFLLLPWLGAQHSIMVAVGLNLLVGMCFVAASGWRRPRQRAAVVVACAGIAIAGIWRLPEWDPMLLNSAPYLYAYRYQEKAARDAASLAQVMTRNRRLLFAQEGLTATVTVVESGGELYLKVNGKTDASSRGDLRSQSLLAHLPLLLHPRPARVLLIGLGSGISLGAAEQHPVEQIECVEISPEVVEAARLFSEVNYDALRDPRVRLYIGDGRNHTAMGRGEYDVIISQPSNLWIAGMADLFTREYFTACRSRLAADGLMCSWVQAYSMREQDFRTVLRTFAQVFPHVTMWESQPGGDYFLLGSRDPWPLACDELQQRFARRRLVADFERIGVGEVVDLLVTLTMTDDLVRAFAGEGPVNTDDNAILEFSAPKGLYAGLLGSQGTFGLRTLEGFRLEGAAGLVAQGPVAESIDTAWRARQAARAALMAMHRGDYGAARSRLAEARGIRAADMEVRRLAPEVALSTGDRLMAGQQPEAAAAEYQWALEVAPEDARMHHRLGLALELLGRPEEALASYERAVDLVPEFVPPWQALAALCDRSQRLSRAEEAYAAGLAADPGNRDLLEGLGRLYVRQRRWHEAEGTLGRALEMAPDDALILNNLGVVHHWQADYATASEYFRRAAKRDPEYVLALVNLADACRAANQRSEARRALERALELDPGNRRALELMRSLGRER